MRRLTAALLLTMIALPAGAQTPPKTVSGVLAATDQADWRPLDPENTLVMTLPAGQVVIELAPAFAPLHAANIRVLAREGYFDGLAIVRVQDNYVTQWGDPLEGEPGARPFKQAKPALPPEFFVTKGMDLAFDAIPGPDAYAAEVGFVDGFPAARDPKTGEAWLAHCYGMVGVSRDGPDSGSGAGLYAVIGHAPRHLDRNITVAGRVVKGIELLSALPRGTGPLGFYETPAERTAILSTRLAADMEPGQRPSLQVLRTGTEAWADYVAARRNRMDEWFVEPRNASDLCNTLPPVRATPAA